MNRIIVIYFGLLFIIVSSIIIYEFSKETSSIVIEDGKVKIKVTADGVVHVRKLFTYQLDDINRNTRSTSDVLIDNYHAFMIEDTKQLLENSSLFDIETTNLTPIKAFYDKEDEKYTHYFETKDGLIYVLDSYDILDAVKK
ncbi:MAG TPA: hypothetical protein VLA13_03350 [Massilibacterium sp.]|nr:hypothetical protein [Massilibacterium sp.]